MGRKIEFWGEVDDKYLTHTEMNCAIEDILDGMEVDILTASHLAKNIKDMPETIKVYGFARQRLSDASKEFIAKDCLERLLEGLDDEYAEPDAGYSDPTDGMIKASKEFVSAVLKEYVIWACEPVKHEIINVREWIKNNRPDWLENKDNGKETH